MLLSKNLKKVTTGSIAKRTKEKLQLLLRIFRTGDSLRNFSADQFAVTPPEPQNGHLDGAFAHVQICRYLGLGGLALLTGQQTFQAVEEVALVI